MHVFPGLVQQSQCRGQYAACALAECTPWTVPGSMASFRPIWRPYGALYGDNMHRETLCRLMVNGVPGAGGHGLSPGGGACPCGWVGPDGGLPAEQQAFAWRTFCFWSCTVAWGVCLSELVTALPSQTTALLCAEVWLPCPHRGMGIVGHDGAGGDCL
jgi:hypothetical protein